MNGLCVFAIRRGDLENRLDTHFYLPHFRKIIEDIKKHSHAQLGDVVSFSKDTTDFSEYPNGRFEYLEISGINLGINFYNTVTTEVKNAPSRAKMKTHIGDIVISTTRPHRGAVAEIVKDGIIASTGFSIIRNISPQINKNWLLHVLLSEVCLQQMLQRSSGGNYPAIIEDEIKRICIPIVSQEKQNAMAATINEALKIRNEKIIESNKLLTSVSNIVLNKLGLVFDTSKVQTSYSVSLTNINGRIDADYYSPKFSTFRKQIEASRFDVVTVGEISQCIITGFAAGKQDQADDLPEEQRVPHLRPFSITPEGDLSFEIKKYVPASSLKESDYCKKNEIIFNNTNSPDLVGKTTVFDSDVLCATSNHMTRITVKAGVNPYYISAFFNVLLSIGYWKLLCTNFNNQAGVNTETLKNVRIPLPPKELQDEIATEIMQRRRKANALRKEADYDWKKAKKNFEEELLEG